MHPHVIGVFENDLMYGHVVSLTRPSANKFDYTIEWYMLRLPYVFTIAHYPLRNSVNNKNVLKLHLQIDINRAKTGNYTFT